MRERSWRVFPTSSLAAPRHVVDQGPIDVGATEADGIEEGIGIRDKVLLIGEFIGHDLSAVGFENIGGRTSLFCSQGGRAAELYDHKKNVSS